METLRQDIASNRDNSMMLNYSYNGMDTVTRGIDGLVTGVVDSLITNLAEQESFAQQRADTFSVVKTGVGRLATPTGLAEMEQPAVLWTQEQIQEFYGTNEQYALAA